MNKVAERLSLSRRGFFIVCIVAMGWSLLGAVGCGSQSNDHSSGEATQSGGEAFIKASPNPVRTAGEKLGKTTISWDTGGKAASGQIYVSPKGKPEKLFAEGKQGSQAAPWIQANMTYEFRLYAGTEHKTLLDSVEVTRSSGEATQSGGEAFIKASPNPVRTAGEKLGKTTISWDTGGKAASGQIYVSPKGKPEKLFAEGKQGSQAAPWIHSDITYKFRLYAGTEHKTLLDSVRVKRK